MTLQAGDLIDEVDRERGANRNQSRGIQLIHAKRLTHHPNTRYTVLVMDSCNNLLSNCSCICTAKLCRIPTRAFTIPYCDLKTEINCVMKNMKEERGEEGRKGEGREGERGRGEGLAP